MSWGDLLSAVVTAAVTVAIALWLVPRQFVQQRWWERKAQAYADVIAALSQMYGAYHELYPQYTGESKLTEAYRGRLWEQVHRADAVIRPAAITGGFLLSAAAASHLDNLLKVLDADVVNDLAEETAARYSAAKDTLEAVTAEAKRDLRLP